MKPIQQAKYLELLSVLGIGGAHPGGLNLTTEIFKHENIHDMSHVLDVGCGTGQTAAYLTHTFGAKVTALDVNQTMLEKAKYRMAMNDLHVNFIEGSIEDTAFADQSFDFILSESVLSFVDKPRALSEIYRLLKTGGRFIAIEQTMNEQLADQDAKQIMQFYGFDSILMEHDWVALLREAGFETIEIQQHETIESEPDFHYSSEIDPALYEVMKTHLEIMVKYQGIIGYRVYVCGK